MAIASKFMRTHQIQSGGVEGIQALQYTTGQTFKIGELVIWDSGGNIGKVIVAAANPTSATIVGVTLQAADTNPGFAAANSPTVFTGRSQTVSVVRPTDNIIFEAEMTNNSSTVVVPLQTDVGVQYGVTAYTGVWTVDRNKTGGTARVNIINIDTDQNVVFFKFILPVAP